MKRWIVGLLLPMALLGSSAFPAGAHPLVRNGPLVFASDRSGKLEIWRSGAAGKHATQLTHTPGRFESIFSDWSPDGHWIAFDSDRRGTVQIFLMDATGGQVRQVTHGGGFNGDPTFTPDGTHLLFERAPSSGCCSNIYSIRVDGTRLQQLTHFTAETFPGEPEQSPDGRWIAFMRTRPGGGTVAIWLMHPDGSGLHAITRQSLDAGHPSWSPDASRIIFNDKFTQPVGDIFTIRPDGTGLHRLTNVAGRGLADYRPDYSPDGTRIVFSHIGPAGVPSLWVMNRDGSIKHRITDPRDGGAFAARWGPAAS
jgi:Tol biopolymer transport system component